MLSLGAARYEDKKVKFAPGYREKEPATGAAASRDLAVNKQ